MVAAALYSIQIVIPVVIPVMVLISLHYFMDTTIDILLNITPGCIMRKEDVIWDDDGSKQGKSVFIFMDKGICEDDNTKKMVCVLGGYIAGITAAVFLIFLFTVEYGCPLNVKADPDWECWKGFSEKFDCVKFINHMHNSTTNVLVKDVMCYRFTGKVPEAAGAAVGVYKIMSTLFILISSSLSALFRKFKFSLKAKRILFFVVFLTIMSVICIIVKFANFIHVKDIQYGLVLAMVLYCSYFFIFKIDNCSYTGDKMITLVHRHREIHSEVNGQHENNVEI